MNDNTLRMETMINVSIGGPINIKLIATRTTGPSNSGNVSSFIIPSRIRVIEITNDGIRLIRPARSTYLGIGVLISKSRESNQFCLLSVSDMLSS
jgi:hypothetical protein